MSTEDLPSWLLTPSLSRFRLAKKVTEGQMTLQVRATEASMAVRGDGVDNSVFSATARVRVAHRWLVK